MELIELSPGTYVQKEDSQKDAALIYVVSGSLTVSQKSADQNVPEQLFVVHTGELVGGLAVLTGEPNFFTVRSKHTSWVAVVSKTGFYS